MAKLSAYIQKSHGRRDAQEELDLSEFDEAKRWYEELVTLYPTSLGKELSTQERDDKDMQMSTLTYGEVPFLPLAATFSKIKHKYGGLQASGGKFYDIGSGTGKSTVAAALLHDFDSVVGIELLQGLYDASVQLLKLWDREIVPKLAHCSVGDVVLVHGDATELDLSDATMWFANSTCFDKPLMAALARTSAACKVGCFGITTSKPLPSDKWELLERHSYMMSWGPGTVYIQRKARV